MSAPIYHFWGETEGLLTRVRLNGYPIMDADHGPLKQVAEDVSLWVRPGKNIFRVGATAMPDSGGDSAHFRGRLRRAPRENPDAAQSLWELDWPPAGRPPLPPLAREVELECESPSQLWDAAEPVALTPDVQAEIRSLAMQLHATFARADHTGLAKRMDYRGRDIGRVLGMGEDAGVVSQGKFFKAIMTRAEFEAEALEASSVSLSLLADDLVVWVRNGDRPLLLSKQRQGMEVYLAKIEGQWTPVR